MLDLGVPILRLPQFPLLQGSGQGKTMVHGPLASDAPCVFPGLAWGMQGLRGRSPPMR